MRRARPTAVSGETHMTAQTGVLARWHNEIISNIEDEDRMEEMKHHTSSIKKAKKWNPNRV